MNSTYTTERIEKLMRKSTKYLARVPTAFCTMEYGIFLANFIIYTFADLKDFSFCIEYIDSFMMFAGLILFFSAKH